MAADDESPNPSRSPGRSAKVPPTNGEASQSARIVAGFADLLDEFAETVEAELGDAGEQERQAVARVMRNTLAVQTAGLGEIIAEVMNALPRDGQDTTNRYFAISGAEVAIAQTREIMRDEALRKRSVLEWIKLIIEIIKKILTMITSQAFDFLPLPPKLKKWLNIILGIAHIINNLLDMINKLLVGDGPVDFAALNRTMWQGLEHFWRAQAAREALYAVHAPQPSSA